MEYVPDQFIMATYNRPYSARLARGTLLMLHGPLMSSRYMHLGHSVTVESLGVIGAGTSVAFAGWFVDIFAIWLVGTLALVGGLAGWMARRTRLMFRRRRTPGMVFVSESGVGAIMPDTTSIFVQWACLQAHVVRYPRPLVPFRTGSTPCSTGDMHGLLLKGPRGRRIYITHDLDGYNDLLDILIDMNVPIKWPEEAPSSAHGGFIEWKKGLERRTWQERN